MQTETALGAKLAAAGILPRLVALQIAITKFQNDGGTWTEYLNTGRDAFGKGSEGLRGRAGIDDEGFESLADASRQNESEGPAHLADKASGRMPSLSANRNGAGHRSSAIAGKAIVPTPRPVSAAYIDAAKKGAQKIALTVLDSFKVRDGRAIGDLLFGELEGIRANNAMEASVLRQIQRHAGNATANQKIREVIKPTDLERMIQRGAEVADAA